MHTPTDFATFAHGVYYRAPASWSAAVLCRFSLTARIPGCFQAEVTRIFAMAERDTFLLFVRPLDVAGFRYAVTGSIAAILYGEP
jgi:hypothetical protein